ncbi:hypothetical protein MPLB_230015 [Mesorhizobium sp. ORS 3324]|nr:hypothetical protein MPLB_230015 [Mesorhizobium sp. ORS 3324]
MQPLIRQQLLDAGIERHDLGAQVLAFLLLDIELDLLGCLLQRKLRQVGADHRQVLPVDLTLVLEDGQPFLRNLPFGHGIVQLRLEPGGFGRSLAPVVRGLLKPRLQLLDLGAQAAQLRLAARQLGRGIAFGDAGGLGHLGKLGLRRLQRLLQPRLLLFMTADLGHEVGNARGFAGVGRRELVELVPGLGLALLRLLQVDREADLLLTQQLVLGSAPVGLDGLGGQSLDDLAEFRLAPGALIAHLDQLEPHRRERLAQRLPVLDKACLALLPGLGRAVALALFPCGVEQLFRQVLVFRGQSGVRQLQLIGAQRVAMQDIQHLARHLVRGGDLCQPRLDLFQMALPVAEEPGDGLQGGQPGLGMRRQPRCRRVGLTFGGRILAACRQRLVGIRILYQGRLFVGRKTFLESFRQIRLKLLKFLVYVLGTLDQGFEIHNGTPLTLTPAVLLNELLIYPFTFRAGTLSKRRKKLRLSRVSRGLRDVPPATSRPRAISGSNGQASAA